jgi:hypothetical protein
MVGVFMGHQDRPETIRIRAHDPHASDKFPGAQTGIDEQGPFRTIDEH